MNQNFQSLPIPVFKVEKVFQIVAGGNRGGKSNGGRGRGNRICTHCGMTNHVVDNCYKKYGYPFHWQQQNGAVIRDSRTTLPTMELLKTSLNMKLMRTCLMNWILGL
jgi:hypothetical protein